MLALVILETATVVSGTMQQPEHPRPSPGCRAAGPPDSLDRASTVESQNKATANVIDPRQFSRLGPTRASSLEATCEVDADDHPRERKVGDRVRSQGCGIRAPAGRRTSRRRTGAAARRPLRALPGRCRSGSRCSRYVTGHHWRGDPRLHQNEGEQEQGRGGEQRPGLGVAPARGATWTGSSRRPARRPRRSRYRNAPTRSKRPGAVWSREPWNGHGDEYRARHRDVDEQHPVPAHKVRQDAAQQQPQGCSGYWDGRVDSQGPSALGAFLQLVGDQAQIRRSGVVHRTTHALDHPADEHHLEPTSGCRWRKLPAVNSDSPDDEDLAPAEDVAGSHRPATATRRTRGCRRSGSRSVPGLGPRGKRCPWPAG